MRYLALATDYDGTVATHGALLPDTVAALERLRASGRKLILVTGRELPDLKSVCPRLDVFDLVVVENGALLFDPHTRTETQLAPPPPVAFGEALKAAGVGPLSIAQVMISTLEDQKELVLDTIQRLGLGLQMIVNKGSVMILPSGVNKATGLLRALRHLRISPRNVVGVGDAENDHDLLAACELAVSVAGALPSLKERSDLVTSGDAGAGVAELIGRLLENDLYDVPARRTPA